MRSASLLAGLVVFSLTLTGTAHAATASTAHPIRDRALTANPFYRTGTLKAFSCPEEVVEPNDVASAKRYLTGVLDCLNTAWGAHFKRAGLPFSKARIGFITKPRRYCRTSWGQAAAMYCPSERRFVVLLNDELLEDPSDLVLFNIAAHEYGHHLQKITGIERAYVRHPFRGKSELNEQSRRMELQAECLAGVFFGSVWNSLDRASGDWKWLLDVNRASGDERSKVRDHGKGRNIAAWLDKGRRARAPKACNTWAAPASKVS
jgi:predicted metalloprotease